MTSTSYGAEYDYMFTEMTTGQLWDALTAAERIYSDRVTIWHTAVDVFKCALDGVTTAASTGLPVTGRLDEMWAEVRGARAEADEQGKMVAAINRAIRSRALSEARRGKDCPVCGAPAGLVCDPGVLGPIMDGRHVDA